VRGLCQRKGSRVSHVYQPPNRGIRVPVSIIEELSKCASFTRWSEDLFRAAENSSTNATQKAITRVAASPMSPYIISSSILTFLCILSRSLSTNPNPQRVQHRVWARITGMVLHTMRSTFPRH
jgi:hypothetical protein